MAASARDCIFCKIVRREVPASVVREDSSTLAFMDIRPMSPGHVLVIPKGHAAYVEDLPVKAVGPILEAAREISRAMRTSGIRCEAVSFYLANGAGAGQEVSHTHLHLIPRWRGDGFGLRVRPEYGRIADRTELDGFALKIRTALGRSPD
jgi:histidine triad (HIT) family protein